MRDDQSSILRWSWFQAYVALARCGSQSAASRYLGCSQPTVGHRVKKLEAWTGDRLGTGHSPYVPTETGRELLALIKKITRNLEQHRVNKDSALSDFKLEWVVIFYVMRKYKSQSKSIEVLGLSQPEISRKIISLERWLGQSLFDASDGWQTTEFGESFLSSSDSMLSRLDLFRSSVLRRIKEKEERIQNEIDQHDMWILEKHWLGLTGKRQS